MFIYRVSSKQPCNTSLSMVSSSLKHFVYNLNVVGLFYTPFRIKNEVCMPNIVIFVMCVLQLPSKCRDLLAYTFNAYN